MSYTRAQEIPTSTNHKESMKSVSRETSVTKVQEPMNTEKQMEKMHTIYEWKIVWRTVIVISYFHLAGLYGLYIAFFKLKVISFLWLYCILFVTGLGITAGAHRLWCHHCYKATWPLKFLLMIFQTAAFQDEIYHWVRDHRVHHKFTDTDADPYNSRRGFFFSHVGWLLIRKHPSISSTGATIDCSDLERDPFVVFQRKWYFYLMPLCCFIIPTIVPYWFWGENLSYAWHANLFRHCINLNGTWAVNSVAHMWGTKPYDKSITPTNNSYVALITFGEGWHNYHHIFPWDYKTAELGNYGLNITTAFIDFCAYLGLAYDLKSAPVNMIKRRLLQNRKDIDKSAD